jgi:uncharacterized protein
MQDNEQFQDEFAMALFDQDLKRAAELLEIGAGVNYINQRGSTPLHDMIEHGKIDAVRFLLSHGADPNRRDIYGQTPLHHAVDSELQEAIFIYDTRHEYVLPRIDLTTLLLLHGADPNVRSAQGETPYEWAVSYGHQGAVELMLEHGAVDTRTGSPSTTDRTLRCVHCDQMLAVRTNGDYEPSEESLAMAGRVRVPNLGWFCDQQCGNRYESLHQIRFHRGTDGAISYD